MTALLAEIGLLTLVNYQVTTFCLWFGHCQGHHPRSPLRDHHVRSHHRLYRDSAHCRSDTFRLARGKYDSNKALLPWLFIPLIAEWILLRPSLATIGCTQIIVFTAFFAWLHAQFHLRQSVLHRWKWFRQARARHDIHHDEDLNFAVGDHLWDRLFGTFVEAAETFSEKSDRNRRELSNQGS